MNNPRKNGHKCLNFLKAIAVKLKEKYIISYKKINPVHG